MPHDSARHRRFFVCLTAAFVCSACRLGGEADETGGSESELPPIVDVDGDWPWEPNEYSWDGSWQPEPSDFPLEGLLDAVYFDGHAVEGVPSPILPPGAWDWEDTGLLAVWNSFADRLGTFEALSDGAGHHFGWRLQRAAAEGVAADAILQAFHGSSGPDILDFGPAGSFASAGNPLYGDPVNFGDGPDVFRVAETQSATARLGSSATGSARDNDLVLLGTSEVLAAGSYDVLTTGIHTGPDNDLVFVNNWERSLIDLGNGADGRTDTIDPEDRRDIAVIGGNARDFRVFGGRGDDLFIWHVDEVNQLPDSWLGPNFFGGGSWGDALYADDGVDRLVMNVPPDTQMVTRPGDSAPGTMLVFVESDYQAVVDGPTEDDPNGRYYVTAPVGPEGEHTLTMQYQSADGSVDTAWFYVTDVEELQMGVGADARVYRLDDVAGTATADESLEPVQEIPNRAQYEALVASYGDAG